MIDTTKDIFSSKYLNYHSAHPTSQKIGIIIRMIDKIMLLSHSTFHEKNFKLMINILLKNDYPLHLIFKIENNRIKYLLNNKLTKHVKEKTTIESPSPLPDKKKFFVIPYIKQLSDALSKSIKNKKGYFIDIPQSK